MKHVARSTLIIAAFFGIDKVLGLIRQVFIARQFGLTYEIDVFNAANNIPDLLSALISGGALGVALIPVLSEYMEQKGRPSAWDLFSRILNLAFLVTAAISILIILFARPFVDYVIAPGFPEPQKMLTVSLMRLDLIAILIFSISGLVMAGLQANQHFVLPAIAPMLYNLGQIFGIMILAPEDGLVFGGIQLPFFGFGIYGLVYGVIIGAGLHLLIQVPGLIKYKFTWKPTIDFKHPGVRQVLLLLAPRVATMFFIQMFFITRDNLASRLGEGSVTALNYGWFIMQVPETLIGTAFAIAILPTLSEYIARNENSRYTQTVNHAYRALLSLTIPISVIVAIGIRPLVGILGFDQLGTEMVVSAARFYLLGLTGHALLEISARSFYARQDAITPLLAAFLNAVGYIIFAILLARWMGHTGIALANSISFTLEAVLLIWLLNRRVPGIFAMGSTSWKILAAGLTGGLIVLGANRLIPYHQLSILWQAIFGASVLGIACLSIIPIVWREVKELVSIE